MFGTNIEYVTLSAKLSVFVKYFTPETFSDNSKYTREKCIHGDILCVTFKIMEIVLTSNRRDNIALNHEMKKNFIKGFIHITGVLNLKLSPRFFTRALVDNRKRLTGLTPVFGDLKIKVESITRCADQWTSLYQHCSDIPGKIFPCTCVSVSCQ